VNRERSPNGPVLRPQVRRREAGAINAKYPARSPALSGFRAAAVSYAAAARKPITLHGAAQFGDDHPFAKRMSMSNRSGQQGLRQAGQFRPAQEQRTGAGE